MQAMKTSATWTADKQVPYLYAQYNVFFFFVSQSSHINNCLTKIHNSVVEGFNCREHLPKYILFMPDDDILVSLNHFTYGISSLLGICINWLAKQVERLVDARIEDLYSKCPGATFFETKFIWIKMLACVTQFPYRAKVFALRSKFNNALDDIAEKRKQTHIMNLTKLEAKHFDQHGRLTYPGKLQMWCEIDKLVKKFDKKEIRLIPHDSILYTAGGPPQRRKSYDCARSSSRGPYHY